MKVSVDLRTRHEGDALRRALEDPTCKAVSMVSGILLELPLSGRRAVISFLLDTIARDYGIPPPVPALRLHNGELPPMFPALEGAQHGSTGE